MLINQWLLKKQSGLKRNSKIFSKKTLTCLALSAGISLGGVPLLGHSSAYAASNTWNFQYTGSVQSFTAPYTGTYQLETWGAQGGDNSYGSGWGWKTSGGLGGYSTGSIDLTAGETLYVYVGQQGQNIEAGGSFSGTFNGGGGGNGEGYDSSGGGATDIRTSSDSNWQDDLNSRIIVAGGGGGAGFQGVGGGYGGGIVGGNGRTNFLWGDVGYGGTQTSGGIVVGDPINSGYGNATPGSFGKGGTGAGNQVGASGGGGGWYGGGGAQAESAGGGSSYIGGVQNGQTIPGNQSMPASSGGTEIGQAGDGYARITFVKPADTAPPVTTDNAPTGWINKDVTINLTAADNGGSDVAATYYILDNGGQQSGTSVNVIGEGVHTLTYWSVDNAGNVETHHTITIEIDKTASVTKYHLVPIYGQTSTGKQYIKGFNVALQATDNKSGVKNIQYRTNGGAWVPYTKPFTIYAGATHTVEYYSTDNAGNVEQVNKMDFDTGIFTGAGSY